MRSAFLLPHNCVVGELVGTGLTCHALCLWVMTHSVFGLSKSAEFLSALSTSRATLEFPLFTVRAVRFLLTQTAFLSRTHDCELEGVSYVLERSRDILARGIEGMLGRAVPGRTDVVELLSEWIRVSGEAQKELLPQKVFQVLLSFASLNAPKLLAEIVILLVRVGGAEALKVRIARSMCDYGIGKRVLTR